MSRLIFRPARRQDSMTIAALFRISSDGVADYIWSQYDCPGLSLLAIGEQRYRRENTAFSYQNCTLAERDGRTLGMLHGFPIPRDSKPRPIADPILRAAGELEIPGSFYISSLAVFAGHRRLGIGSRLLELAHAKAWAEGHDGVSLICFAQNRSALRLYRRHGYVPVDSRPIEPHPMIHARGEALLMRRALTPEDARADDQGSNAAIAA